MLTDLCPAPQQLRNFVTGRLPDSSLDAIAEHLETCGECESAMATLDDASDSFIAELKCPAADESFVNEVEFHQALPVVERFEAETEERPTSAPSRQVLGQYMLVERLGTGGMGTVYKALHTKLEKFVALKILRTKRMLDDRAIARFDREMKAVGKLKHENIVQASDAGEFDGKQYLVMEYIKGAEFSELIQRNERLSVADACELVRQAAIGLQHAHEHGLVHRDMKPSNLMLAEDGCVKILDLGLAGYDGEQFTPTCQNNTESGRDDLTLDGHIMGTAEYIAPEQAANSHDVDIRADIYGLGCTLYALLAGTPPFQRNEFATPRELIDAHQTSDRPSIADLPPDLARIINCMLAIDPDERFTDPAEVADALSRFTTESNIAALLSPERKPTEETGRTSVRWASPPVDGRLWKAILQKRLLVALTILAVMAFAAFGIVFHLNTPYGIVEIHTNDPNVEISVKQAGKEIDIINEASGWDIRLKEGKYDLNLKLGNDKFKLSDNTVTVSRDDKVVLRVTLRKPKLLVPALPYTPESVLESFGAKITKKDGVITEIFLVNSKIDDTHLGHIKKMNGLESLTVIGCTNVTDAGFAHLKELPQLKGLNVAPSNITDAGLANLTGLKNMWFLGLNGTMVSDAGLKHLVENSKITVLYLNGTRVTDAGLLFLETMKDMHWLDLGATGVTDAGLARLGHMSELQLLHLNSTAITDAGLAHLTKLPNIQSLHLSNTKITDLGMLQLAKLRKLKDLHVLNTAVTEAGASVLKVALPGVTVRHGKSVPAPVTTDEFEKYGKAAGLMQWAKSKGVANNVEVKLDDRGRVTSIHMGGGEITDEGMSRLKNLEDVESLTLSYTYACTAESLKHVQQMTKVKYLRLWGNYNFSNGIGYVSGMKEVETLFTHKLRITDENMKFLKDMKKCKLIQMTLNPVVTDEGIAQLAGLTELESIYLTCDKLTDECLKYFHDMSKLKSILVSSPSMTRAAFQELAHKLPNLETVNNEPVEKLFESGPAEKEAKKKEVDNKEAKASLFDGADREARAPVGRALLPVKSAPPDKDVRPTVVELRGRDCIELTRSMGSFKIDGEFTVEVWVRFKEGRGRHTLMGDFLPADLSPMALARRFTGWMVEVKDYKRLHDEVEIWSANGQGIHGLQTSAKDLFKDKWHHFAMVKNELGYQMFVDGISRGYTNKIIESGDQSPTNVYIGAPPKMSAESYKGKFHGDRHFCGDIRLFRLSKGARYADNFEPAAKFDTDANTLALLDASQRNGDSLIDLSGNERHGIVLRDGVRKIDLGDDPNVKARWDAFDPIAMLNETELLAIENRHWENKRNGKFHFVYSRWATAAADLNPAKAKEILLAAFARFNNGMGSFDQDCRVYLAQGLWKHNGLDSTAFITDWFFGEKTERGAIGFGRHRFADYLGSKENKPLLAQIINDPRLPDIEWHTQQRLARSLNKVSTAVVITEDEMQKAWHPLGIGHYNTNKEKAREQYPKETAELEAHLAEWRQKMKAAVAGK